MIAANRVLPSVALIGVIIGVWWTVVVATGSVVFPTPWQVVTGTIELIRDGTLWEHIGASLFRVGAGFGLPIVAGMASLTVAGLAFRSYRARSQPRSRVEQLSR